MEELIKKSSLYDIVSMIIPGFVLVYLSARMLGLGWVIKALGSEDDTLSFYTLSISLCYVIGLIIHRISKCMFDPCLRNNPEHIKEAICRLRANHKNKTTDRYYKKYYSIIQTSSVPIMEAQVSFLRSMVVVVLFIIGVAWYCICICKETYSFPIPACCVMVSCLILEPLMIITMIKIQKEVCFRIVEDSYYLGLVSEKTLSQSEGCNEDNEETNKKMSETE